VVEKGTRQPVAGQRYRIIRESGETIEGTTDSQGRTVTTATDGPEDLEIELLMEEPEVVVLQASDGP
jgi:uncharacterized protein (DUF2345 family)